MTMSITTTLPTVASEPTAAGRVSWHRVARSEWIKLRSTRSSLVLLGLTALVIVGVWALTSSGFTGDSDGGGFSGTAGMAVNPYTIGLTISVGLAQLAAGVLGVMLVTGEYASGMVRATFAAVPARLPVLVGKAAVVATVVFLVTIPALVAAFFASSLILGPELQQSITDPDMLRALLGAGLYLAGIAVIGSALGWLLRSAAGAIAVFVALVILAPMLLPLIPLDAVQTVVDYLPSTLGQEAFRLPGLFDDLVGPSVGPWTGLALFAGYALIGLAAAAILLRRRDA